GIFTQNACGYVRRGPRWGDPRQFCESEAEYQDLLAGTPALYGVNNAGPRPANEVSRRVRMNQGVGREAIHAELRIDDLQRIAPFRVVATEAANKEAHLGSPDLGARLSAQSREWLVAENRQVQMVVSDGLSAEAVHHNMNDLLPVLMEGFA